MLQALDRPTHNLLADVCLWLNTKHPTHHYNRVLTGLLPTLDPHITGANNLPLPANASTQAQAPASRLPDTEMRDS